jgi:ABC-type transport system involved in cytochrome c biogenesis permease subunit
MTLTGGLIMLSIGTYLGGVWANESWGRYWGWDAKETWALVSILVYAFILHMRLIPGLKGIFAYNLATIFGLASIIMTYFGVNYYLSGLHSYAAGDPVPIPGWVYIAVTMLVLISVTAYISKRRFRLFN